jgi:quinoprotein glucose dehydrogenase
MRMRFVPLGLICTLVCALLTPAPTGAQTGTTGDEWSVYGGDAGHTRYAPLDQIDATNAGDLEIAWRWSGRNFGPNPRTSSQTTPLMVDGVLYATAGRTRNVVAIDPGSGETLWMWRPEEDERLIGAPRINPGRGVAYWTDGTDDARIYVVTPGYQLAALDTRTGRPIAAFGTDGIVDLMEEHRRRDGVPLIGTIGASSPAVVVGDVVIVGSALHIGDDPPTKANTPGDVRGYDARTGDLLWTFKTIPEFGEEGYESWQNESATYTGNAGAWAPISFDAETGYVYLPTEAPTGDFYGGHRHGDNLFSTSLVCLDAKTGEKVWHFQTIHHDIWDWDNTTAPILGDIVVEGRPRKIVALPTKQGFTFVFDRITGEPVWPIEERAVPQTDVPGEWTAATQPFPTKPPPFALQGVTEDDLIDYTPELKAQALEFFNDTATTEIYTPPSLADAPDGTKGLLQSPRSTGGANWEGGALDPETGMLYVGAVNSPMAIALEPSGDRSDMDYIGVYALARIGRRVPVVKPPWGTITALDLSTGDLAWTIANADTPEAYAEELGLDVTDLPRTGTPTHPGLLVTRTLLFAGEGEGGGPTFRAHDKATGAILAEIELPNSQVGLPMTYMHEGRQFIVISVGGGGESAEIVALALPR